MNYVMNEYSLRGQFPDLEAFYDSLRTYTIPALKKIENENKAVIWKKETFWQQEVCPGLTLQDIRPTRNERNMEVTALKRHLLKLYAASPFWNETESTSILATRYCFDEEISNTFPVFNCFIKAYTLTGKIISFEHEAYLSSKLEFYIESETGESCCQLDNIYDTSWWQEKTEITSWPRINGSYRVQVRAREIDRHQPHFHVEYNEYSAVFAISDGHVIEKGSPQMPDDMIKTIQLWYKQNAEALETAWNKLHKPLPSRNNT